MTKYSQKHFWQCFLLIAILGPTAEKHFQIPCASSWKTLMKRVAEAVTVCSAWPLKEGREQHWSRAHYFHLPFAPASAPGELEVHRRNQKTWVESWLCHLLPLWLWVSYLISLGLSFSTGLLRGLKSMISRSVLCKPPKSIKTYIFIIVRLTSSFPILL